MQHWGSTVENGTGSQGGGARQRASRRARRERQPVALMAARGPGWTSNLQKEELTRPAASALRLRPSVTAAIGNQHTQGTGGRTIHSERLQGREHLGETGPLGDAASVPVNQEGRAPCSMMSQMKTNRQGGSNVDLEPEAGSPRGESTGSTLGTQGAHFVPTSGSPATPGAGPPATRTLIITCPLASRTEVC